MEELLSLKWKNHCTTFLQILDVIRKNQMYSDVTLACSKKFYSAHKIVLTACSDYFKEIFEYTDCKKPVIVIKGISCDDLEILLDYMYIGEVNVKQSDITSLIKAAECLQIKGLAVADDEPVKQTKNSAKKSSSPVVKRKRKAGEHDSYTPEAKHFKAHTKLSSSSEIKHYDSRVKMKREDKEEPIAIKKEIEDSYERIPLAEEPFQIDHRLQGVENINLNSDSYSALPSNSHVQKNFLERRLSDTSQPFNEGPSEWSEELNMTYPPFSEYDNSESSLPGSASKIKTKKCHYCFKEFDFQSALKQHILIHTGEKHFTCELCPYKSNLRTNLLRHSATVHGAITALSQMNYNR